MSDSQYPRNSVKRRLNEIDDALEILSRNITDMSDIGLKARLENKITTIQLKREKSQVLAAVAKSQNLLAEMEIMIAQNDINNEIEKLKSFKKIRFDDSYIDSAMSSGKTLQKHAGKSLPSKKSSPKIQTKSSEKNKTKTSSNSHKSVDNNKTQELNKTLPLPNNTGLKNNKLENRAQIISNISLFEDNNNLPSVNNNNKETKVTNKMVENPFKIPQNVHKKITNRPDLMPASVSRRNFPFVISQPRYKKVQTPTSSNNTPYKLIYNDEAATDGGNLFNRMPAAETTDANPYEEMVNDLFRELMCKPYGTKPVQKDVVSLDSVSTVKLEELLSS